MAAKKNIDSNYVTVNLPRPQKHEDNFVFVSVNGKAYKVMKGQPVKVPREVAEVLRNADIAHDEADSYIEAIMN
jgi:hypothetical protein